MVNWFSDEHATFGDRLTGAREASGASQEDLARRLGVKLATLRAWEEDRSEPRANLVQMLAGMLNVSLMWLLTGEGEGVANPDDNTNIQLPDVLAELSDLRRIRNDLVKTVDRLNTLEKRLRRAASGH